MLITIDIAAERETTIQTCYHTTRQMVVTAIANTPKSQTSSKQRESGDIQLIPRASLKIHSLLYA